MGYQGPDQGFVFKLVGQFDNVQPGSLHRNDIDAGCVAVALKRAAHFGRGPVVHDLKVAYTLFGFLDTEPDNELVALREDWFAEIGHGHHHAERRALADRVRIEVLSQTPAQVEAAYGRDWRASFDLD